MRLEGSTTIGACERQLRELVAALPDEALKIPTRMRYLAAGGEASIVQLIVSWAQRATNPHLQTFISGADDEQIIDFSRRLYGLIAALCAQTITGTSSVDLTAALHAAAFNRLAALQGPNPKEAFRGPSREIICADHIGRGSPYLLYEPSSQGSYRLRSRDNFRSLATWLIRQTIPNEYVGNLNPSTATAVGAMLFEVFKNTEDHALVDENGNILNISIRAVKASHCSITPSDLARIVADFEPLANYCTSLRTPQGASHTHLFELSVLDSGPGFASSWTKTPLSQLSIEEERRAVFECFGPSSAKNHVRFGQGLPHVLRVLREENGFLRLRTGRLSLYADFSRSDQAIEGPDMLRSWAPDDGAELAPAAGSLLTIIIPMTRRS